MKYLYITLVSALFSVSCNREENIPDALSVASEEISVNVGETTQIKAFSSEKITFSVENLQIARISEQGEVLGRLKGETIAKITDGKTIKEVKINVKATSNLFFEPFLVTSEEEFKEKYATSGGEYAERGYTEFYSGRVYSAYTLEKGTEKEYKIVYYHDTATKEVMIETPNNDLYKVETLLYWISERFLPLKQEGDFFHYISHDKSIEVTFDADMARETTQIKIFKIN